jgi:kexin
LDLHERGSLVSRPHPIHPQQPLTNQPARGESGVGTWTIIVKDTNVNRFSGKFIDWHLKLWGETRDASKAKVLPMPTEEDDNDHAQIATTSLPATLTTIAPAPTDANDQPPPADATDLPNRPVNSKPTTTSSPPGDNTEEQSQTETETSPEAAETSSASGNKTWLPSFLPTFGVSAATQAWIYGSLVLIVLFCSGLGVYLYLARRRRLRNNPRNDYEFELLDDEEAEGLASDGGRAEKGVAGLGAAAAGGRRGAAGGGRRTRGGELYDAFAGESDSDEEDGDSDDYADVAGAMQYRDREDGSEGSGSPIRVSEKLPGRRDSDESEVQHVVGDDDDEEEDGAEGRPLQGGGR